jgi:hypothetical protein
MLNGMVVTLDGDPVEVEMELESKSAAPSFLIPAVEEDALGPYTEIIFRFPAPSFRPSMGASTCGRWACWSPLSASRNTSRSRTRRRKPPWSATAA